MIFRRLSVVLAAVTVSDSFAAQCSAAERGLWMGVQPFADRYDTCSRSSFGVAAKTSECIGASFPGLTPSCSQCFGLAAECGRDNCTMECIGSSSAPRCLDCIKLNCTPNMKTCVGAASDAELPLTPTDKTATSVAPTTIVPATPENPAPETPKEAAPDVKSSSETSAPVQADSSGRSSQLVASVTAAILMVGISTLH
jgi:hypothetical protein